MSIKSKARNRTQIKLLNSIVRIPSFLSDNNMCCQNFKCTTEMLKMRNSKILYDKTTEKEHNFQYLEEDSDILKRGTLR
ncbi:hypothetical protein SK128_010554 [Halocaridina rubra]|uniref:Uncharacterized protein n=1 Tax=Halocaridina rubra TaxID=373956 RepID=A0AAN9AFT9_HALRR